LSSIAPTTTKSRLVPYLVILAAGLVAHGLSLRAQFYMDDFMHIVGHTRVTEGEGLFSWRRLLPYLAYYSMTKVGLHSATAFHALNLAIHLVLSVVVFAAMRDFDRFLGAGKKFGPFSMPLLVALIFAGHPLASEPVNYARCTPMLLVGLFSFVAAWLTLRWFFVPKQRGLISVLIVLPIAGATISKEPGLIHALGSVAMVAWFCRGKVARVDTDSNKRGLGLFPVVFAEGLLLLAIPAIFLIGKAGTALAQPQFMDHALTHCRVFWMYVQRMVLPIDLSVDHYIQWTVSWSDLFAVLGLVGIVMVLGGALWLGKRAPLFAMAVVLGAFPLLMRMGYVIGHEMMVEYRTYPSLPWVAVLLAGALSRMATKVKPQLVTICTTAFLLFLVSLSLSKSTLWSKPDALARDALRQYPDNNRARAALMRQLLIAKRYDLMTEEYLAAKTSISKMVEHNRSNDNMRVYDHDRLFGDWAFVETAYAPGLVATSGAEVAKKHIDRTIEVLKGEGEKIQEGDPLKSLVDFRERLEDFREEEASE
jgi:hypothetical protein